jgi:hypothetical protein
MTSDQWKMAKWAAIALFVAISFYLFVIGATIGKFILLTVVLAAAVGAWKFADKQESDAKADELRGR